MGKFLNFLSISAFRLYFRFSASLQVSTSRQLFSFSDNPLSFAFQKRCLFPL
ncbi:unnamed protein product [Meloidogyne enterolobii]|uniref:Uncharacterized protein n=2 Tax=Meloidogyne enterolobii TaxID=390850 RepID=A0A6V7X9G9_MELEN|nr:unnamed protein product [Meloidogyne enterolobii]